MTYQISEVSDWRPDNEFIENIFNELSVYFLYDSTLHRAMEKVL